MVVVVVAIGVVVEMVVMEVIVPVVVLGLECGVYDLVRSPRP